MGNSGSSSAALPPLQHVAHCATEQFMGTWFVIGVKPTMFEKTSSNAVEVYTRMPEDKRFDVDIEFKYNKDEPIKSPLKSLPQKGWVQGDNKDDSGLWKVSPLWPIKMPYLILEVADDYSHTVIGYPNREYCWIMYRKPVMPDSLYKDLTKRLEETHKYDLKGLRKVPQVWTREEREKRGLTAKEIPDSMLTK